MYAPGILPYYQRTWEMLFLREIISHTSFMVEWSYKGAIICIKWSWRGPRRHDGLVQGISLMSQGPEKGLSPNDLVMT